MAMYKIFLLISASACIIVTGQNCYYTENNIVTRPACDYFIIGTTYSDGSCRSYCETFDVCTGYIYDDVRDKCRLYSCNDVVTTSYLYHLPFNRKNGSTFAEYIDYYPVCNYYGNFSVFNETMCLDNCQKSANCAGYVLDHTDKYTMCYVYKCDNLTFDATVSSYYISKICVDPICYYQTFFNTAKRPSCNYSSAENKSVESCETYCNYNTNSCDGYIYVIETGICYIYEYPCPGFTTNSELQQLPYYTVGNCGNASVCGYKSVEYYNPTCNYDHDFLGNFTDCSDGCLNSVNCTGFQIHYTAENNTCYLYNCYDLVYDPTKLSMFKRRLGCVNTFCEYRSHGIGTLGDCIPTTINPVLAYDQEHCFTYCEADPLCSGVTVEYETFFVWCYVHYCSKSIPFISSHAFFSRYCPDGIPVPYVSNVTSNITASGCIFQEYEPGSTADCYPQGDQFFPNIPFDACMGNCLQTNTCEAISWMPDTSDCAYHSCSQPLSNPMNIQLYIPISCPNNSSIYASVTSTSTESLSIGTSIDFETSSLHFESTTSIVTQSSSFSITSSRHEVETTLSVTSWHDDIPSFSSTSLNDVITSTNSFVITSSHQGYSSTFPFEQVTLTSSYDDVTSLMSTTLSGEITVTTPALDTNPSLISSGEINQHSSLFSDDILLYTSTESNAWIEMTTYISTDITTLVSTSDDNMLYTSTGSTAWTTSITYVSTTNEVTSVIPSIEPTTSVAEIEATCSCVCKNVTYVEYVEYVQQAINELKVDKSQTSKTVRLSTSANDDRPSSKGAGAVGVVMLTLFFVIILSSDIIAFMHSIGQFIKQLTHKP